MSTIAQEIQPPIRGYVSAFNFFEREVRDRIVMQNPILKHNDHNKIVGDMWKKLKPNEKRKYDEMADADKIRYLKEVAAYNSRQDQNSKKIVPRINPPKGYDIYGEPVDERYGPSDSDGDSSSSKKPSSKQTHELPRKRFKSAYNLFVQQEKQYVIGLGNNGNLQQAVGKYASKRWRMMDDAEKTLYYELEEYYNKTVNDLPSSTESTSTTSPPSLPPLGKPSAAAAAAAAAAASVVATGSGGLRSDNDSESEPYPFSSDEDGDQPHISRDATATHRGDVRVREREHATAAVATAIPKSLERTIFAVGGLQYVDDSSDSGSDEDV